VRTFKNKPRTASTYTSRILYHTVENVVNGHPVPLMLLQYVLYSMLWHLCSHVYNIIYVWVDVYVFSCSMYDRKGGRIDEVIIDNRDNNKFTTMSWTSPESLYLKPANCHNMHTYYTIILCTYHVCDVIYNTRSTVYNLISTHKLLSVIRGIGTVIKKIQVLKPVWVVERIVIVKKVHTQS